MNREEQTWKHSPGCFCFHCPAPALDATSADHVTGELRLVPHRSELQTSSSPGCPRVREGQTGEPVCVRETEERRRDRKAERGSERGKGRKTEIERRDRAPAKSQKGFDEHFWNDWNCFHYLLVLSTDLILQPPCQA